MFFVGAIVAGLYYAYAVEVLFASLIDVSARYRSCNDMHTVRLVFLVFQVIIIHCLVPWLLAFYIKTVWTSPGTVPPAYAEGELYPRRPADLDLLLVQEEVEQIGLLGESHDDWGSDIEEASAQIGQSTSSPSRPSSSPRVSTDQLLSIERSWCSRCDGWRPPRAHHCSVCNQCVLKMDHHCPWVANCVGFANYKFFLQFVGSAWITIIFVVIGMAEAGLAATSSSGTRESGRMLRGAQLAASATTGAIAAPTLDDTVSNSICESELHFRALSGESYAILVGFIFGISFSVALTMFVVLHSFLVCKAKTTIESAMDWPYSPYQLENVRADWRSILGPTWRHWLLPIAYTDPQYRGGLYYPVRFRQGNGRDSEDQFESGSEEDEPQQLQQVVVTDGPVSLEGSTPTNAASHPMRTAQAALADLHKLSAAAERAIARRTGGSVAAVTRPEPSEVHSRSRSLDNFTGAAAWDEGHGGNPEGQAPGQQARQAFLHRGHDDERVALTTCGANRLECSQSSSAAAGGAVGDGDSGFVRDGRLDPFGGGGGLYDDISLGDSDDSA